MWRKWLSQAPVHPITIVPARAIGVMRMRDDKGIDDKIIVGWNGAGCVWACTCVTPNSCSRFDTLGLIPEIAASELQPLRELTSKTDVPALGVVAS